VIAASVAISPIIRSGQSVAQQRARAGTTGALFLAAGNTCVIAKSDLLLEDLI
jgi:hypothetical protein